MHIVFIGVTKPGIEALIYARNKGLRITWFHSKNLDWSLSVEDRKLIKSLVDRVVYVESIQDTDSVYNGMAELNSSEPIDAIIPIMHAAVLSAALSGEKLSIKTTNLTGVNNTINKRNTREILRRNNLPSVRFLSVRTLQESLDAANEIGYPVIIKPITGFAKLLLKEIHSAEEMVKYFSSWDAELSSIDTSMEEKISKDFIIEKVEVGKMYSVEFAVTESGKCYSIGTIYRKRGLHNPILEIGSTIPSGLTISELNNLDNYIERVVKALDLKVGIFHVEVIYGANGPVLIEVNPRVAGGGIPAFIEVSTGVNIFHLLVDIFTDYDPDIPLLEYKNCSSQSLIAAISDSVVSSELANDWFLPFKEISFQASCSLSPGQSIKGMSSNYGSHGFVRVIAETTKSADQKIEDLISEISKKLGFELVEHYKD